MICPECGEEFITPLDLEAIEKNEACVACEFEIYLGIRERKERTDAVQESDQRASQAAPGRLWA